MLVGLRARHGYGVEISREGENGVEGHLGIETSIRDFRGKDLPYIES